ncbi:unnamed protein product [Diamesa tonsa]
MVSTLEEKRQALALKLYQISAFKFGDFVLKSGEHSPVYFDLRVIVSYPKVMDELTDLMKDFMEDKQIVSEQLCGVPYTALPIATLLSVKIDQPMLIRRKEAKAYGTKKLIEGKFNAGERCLIIEDVVTTGSSIIETVNDLRSEGLRIEDAIVVVNREQGGVQNISQQGIVLHSMFTLSYLLEVLKKSGKIEESMVKAVANYISANQVTSKPVTNLKTRTTMTFAERAGVTKSEVSKTLFNIMELKKTNLCIAADLTKAEDILNLVEQTGPFICLLKTHVDIIEDFSVNFVNSLKSLAEKHNFLIMEDRKFADIGNTVSLQYAKGSYLISSWADLVTAHSLPGTGILKGLRSALNGNSKTRGVFLLSEMSSEGNLITPEYSAKTLEMAADSNYSDFVSGIVSQSSISSVGLIQLTPGVKIEEGVDSLGQQYNTPEYIVNDKGADIAVVGRGIIMAKNPKEMAKIYRDRLWAAYVDRLIK